MRTSLAFIACSVAATAFAQTQQATDPQFDIQLLYPSPGANSFFATESGDINPHLTISTGLNINYAREPLSVRIVDPSGNEEDVGRVIENRVDFNVMASIGLFNYVDLGFVFPLIAQGGFQGDAFAAVGLPSETLGSPTDFTQGDLRIIPKVRPFSLDGGVFAVSLIPTVIIPTGMGADYASERNVTFAPSIALSSRFSIMHVALQAGYKWRDTPTQLATITIHDEIFASVGAGVRLNLIDSMPIEIIGEVMGRTPARAPFGVGVGQDEEVFQSARTSIEGDLGVRLHILDSVLIGLGGGGGFTPGLGSPAPRVFLDFKYVFGSAGPADQDGDGIPDDIDQCPTRKEDFDGFEDEDGCPDLDNDGDNVLDEDDQCPNEPEDRDGFQDEDGCPDPDNDQDGIPDELDQCPLQPEDFDGFEDEDGCPDLDNDGDGIADAVDQCPNEPEDFDGFMDHDGCPDPDNDGDGLPDINDLCPNHAEDFDGFEDDDGCPEDNDGDGIPDELDQCPNEPETYNGIDDEDGCPETLKVKSLVSVTEEKIEIKEKIFFRTGRSSILPKSFNLLDQVVSVLKNYKHIRKVRIEGHTDSRGNKRRNMKLSQDRAQEVRRYLINKGIEPDRLEAVGYGPEQPIASNRTRRGREQNRRVEFVIAEQKPIGEDVSETQPPPPTPPAEPEIEMPLDDPASEPAPEGGAIDSPLFEVGPSEEAPPPPPEPGKGKGKGKGKKKQDEPEIEFNF